MAKKPVPLTRAPREPVPLAEVAVRLHPADDVPIAKLPLAHRKLILGDEGEVRLRQLVPAGHKLALRAVREGEAVRRYGQIIGFATRPIEPGDQVHTHNIDVKEVDRNHDFCADYEAPGCTSGTTSSIRIVLERPEELDVLTIEIESEEP